jgi:peptidylprolyl isomerase
MNQIGLRRPGPRGASGESEQKLIIISVGGIFTSLRCAAHFRIKRKRGTETGDGIMKRILAILLVAASAAVANPERHSRPVESATCTAGIKLPPGVPPAKGPVQSIFALRYQDIKVGAGAEAEPSKLLKVQYIYWLAANGQMIQSTYGRVGFPLVDKNGKPILGDDGKPKRGPDLTVDFLQGRHAVINGLDQGVLGMKAGGKRRLFVPWQLAYGAKGDLPAIPPEADLIFDVELVDVAEPPAPAAR